MHPIKTVAAIAALSMLALPGCSSVVNQGGDTTCKTFLTQDDDKQNDAITAMLKDRGDDDPSGAKVSVARAAVSGYCQTMGNEDSKISEAPQP